MMANVTDSEGAVGNIRAAADLLRALLDELPPAGASDVGLRSKVEQRTEALDDVLEFHRN